MVQQLLSCSVNTMNVNLPDFSMIEDSIQAAEGLVNALIGAKRRFSVPSNVGNSDSLLSPMQWSLPQQQQQSTKRCRLRSKQSVNFSDEQTVHIIEAVNDTTSVRGRWYQEDEYKAIKDEYLSTLVAYTKVNMQIAELDETRHCLQGLETQISILILRMPYRNRQKKVVKSVLSLQQVQRTMKQQDCAALREMSLIVSKQDVLKARNNATPDISLI
jgi:hypothetical protein